MFHHETGIRHPLVQRGLREHVPPRDWQIGAPQARSCHDNFVIPLADGVPQGLCHEKCATPAKTAAPPKRPAGGVRRELLQSPNRWCPATGRLVAAGIGLGRGWCRVAVIRTCHFCGILVLFGVTFSNLSRAVNHSTESRRSIREPRRLSLQSRECSG